jgi:FkbM family methyltransferase
MSSKFVIYGANGYKAELAYNMVKSIGGDVIGFTDGNEALYGKEFYNVKCKPIDEYIPFKDDITVIVATLSGHKEIFARISACGLSYLTINQLAIESNGDKISKARGLFEDELSVNTFDAILNSRLSLKYDLSAVAVAMETEYFGFFNSFEIPNAYVDLGAFVGDTVEKFCFYYIEPKKIYAFEPFDESFERLKARRERLLKEWLIEHDNFVIEKAFVGEHEGVSKISYNKNKAGAAISEIGITDVPVFTLDGYFKDKEIDFIKADIEGSEMQMLKGAKKIIMRSKPKLAIASYHLPCDIWDIPLYIKAIMPEYNVSIRQHNSKSPYDNVIYAYV